MRQFKSNVQIAASIAGLLMLPMVIYGESIETDLLVVGATESGWAARGGF